MSQNSDFAHRVKTFGRQKCHHLKTSSGGIIEAFCVQTIPSFTLLHIRILFSLFPFVALDYNKAQALSVGEATSKGLLRIISENETMKIPLLLGSIFAINVQGMNVRRTQQVVVVSLIVAVTLEFVSRVMAVISP